VTVLLNDNAQACRHLSAVIRTDVLGPATTQCGWTLGGGVEAALTGSGLGNWNISTWISAR
jgi:hypothetical protein